jgi:hypothetical protein
MAVDTKDRHSFIVRIWREGPTREWKAWVQHADSGASITVGEMGDLLAFIEAFKAGSQEGAVQEPLRDSRPTPSGLK